MNTKLNLDECNSLLLCIARACNSKAIPKMILKLNHSKFGFICTLLHYELNETMHSYCFVDKFRCNASLTNHISLDGVKLVQPEVCKNNNREKVMEIVWFAVV